MTNRNSLWSFDIHRIIIRLVRMKFFQTTWTKVITFEISDFDTISRNPEEQNIQTSYIFQLPFSCFDVFHLHSTHLD